MQARFPTWCGALAAAALALAAGCADKTRVSADAGPSAAPGPPPPIEVRADRTDLVFSYIVPGSRDFATATTIEQVPAQARRTVVVTDLSLSPEDRRAGRYIYLADLSAPRDDSTYPVSVASRYGFEANPTGTSSASAPAARRGVIMYSASWCGVCKKAKRLMKAWSVPFEEKDVEASRSARNELAAKAAAQGFQPGGVPVIDVDGTILQGLDERALKSALRQHGYL